MLTYGCSTPTTSSLSYLFKIELHGMPAGMQVKKVTKYEKNRGHDERFTFICVQLSDEFGAWKNTSYGKCVFASSPDPLKT